MVRELERKPDGYIDPEDAWKFNRMSHEVRMARFPEIWAQNHADPRHLGCRPAPRHVQAHFERVWMDYIKEGRVRLYFDPWYQRYVIWERVHTRECEDVWARAQIIQKAPQREPQVLPKDLEELSDYDGRYDPNIGVLGDFHEPTEEDFAWLRSLSDRMLNNPKTWGKDNHNMRTKAATDEFNRVVRDYEADFRDHHFNAAVYESNQVMGGLNGYHVIPQTSLEHLLVEIQDERLVEEEVKAPDGRVLYKKKVRKHVLEKVPATRFLNADGRFVTIRGTISAESVVLEQKTFEDVLAQVVTEDAKLLAYDLETRVPEKVPAK